MATTSSPTPILYSVLTSSHDTNDDFVNQLRNHLNQIETNVQQTLNKIQQRKSYSALSTNTNPIDSQTRNQFFDLLKNVAIKNNLPFDEPLFRQQFLEKQNSSSSPQVDILRDRPTLIIDTNDQHLSPVNNNRRSQFAPVLSSTPVHQTSPITPIPVDLTLATPSVAPPVLTINSTDLPAVPPSAIVPQRANVGGRPPRIPRGGESVTRSKKKDSSPIKEESEEIVVAKEIHITSKRRIESKQNIIDDNIEVIIEEQNDIRSDVIKQVQSTPLRGRKKKMNQEDKNLIPQLEPPPPPMILPENEILPKKTRTGRGKTKKGDDDEKKEETKPTRSTSVRNRKKQQQQEEEAAQVEREILPPIPPKKTTTTRSKKLVEPTVNTEENPPAPTKLRATPSRGKKKSPTEISEPTVVPSTPKKTTNKSKKRKGNEEINENPIDTIQPPSPKRRGGRNTRSKNTSPIETIPTPPLIEQEQQQQPVSTRSSRRAKKDIEIPIEKQDEIVLNKKTRSGRGKKITQPNNTDHPITVVDVVITAVTVSAPIPTSTSMDSLVSKPPRPPVARKKKSLAIPPLTQTSPTTPPSSSTQRIQSTSPVNDKLLIPLPIPTSTNRRRQQRQRRAINNSPKHIDEQPLETLPSITRNQKRTRSSVISTPKRVRRDNLLVTAIPSTPGKKRNKCTCEKRRNRVCDICAQAADA